MHNYINSNWYRKNITQSSIKTYEDRNNLNKKIKDLEIILSDIKIIKDNILRNPENAKKSISKISTYKILSSYPKVLKIINNILDVIRDNPHKAKFLCGLLFDEIYLRIKKFKQEREVFIGNLNTRKSN